MFVYDLNLSPGHTERNDFENLVLVENSVAEHYPSQLLSQNYLEDLNLSVATKIN